MIYLIDNYDSFTHNLAQLFWVEGCELRIDRNDQITVQDVLEAKPQAIAISPGPGRPENAGISQALIRAASDHGIPLLGICLGHQAIANVFGAEVTYASALMHGKTSFVNHNGKRLFHGLNTPLTVARYHSLVVDPKKIPRELSVDATTDDGVLMALHHKSQPIYGLQFHPESFVSEHGPRMVRNFLQLTQAT